MKERQEIHCHGCDRYVQFDIEMDLDGNHVLECPECGHEHCRVVKNGKITGDRWAQRNGQTFFASYVMTSTTTTSAASGYKYFTQQAWSNSTSSNYGTTATTA